MNLREIMRDYHPRKHLLYALFFVAASFFFSIKFDLRIPEYERAMRDHYFNWDNFYSIVIREPFREEMFTRFAPWLMLVIMMLSCRFSESAKKFLNARAAFNLSSTHFLFWIPSVILTAIWAADHAWPLITFTMGIIMSCIVFYTRGLFYAIPSFAIVLAFHMFFNFFSFLGAVGRIHLLQ